MFKINYFDKAYANVGKVPNITKGTIDAVRRDINRYKEYMIRQNKDLNDIENFKEFLHHYILTIDVFNLHPQISRQNINKVITYLYTNIIYRKY